MNIIRSLDKLPILRNAVVTTGSFDGVHAGHQKILKRLRLLADKYNGVSVVITFDPHPREVIYPRDDSLQLLTTTNEKLDYLEQYGVDVAVVLPFTVEFSQLSAREYIENFLVAKFHPKCLVAGYDHRFGLNREGDFDLLRSYADKGVFDLVRIEKHEVDEIAISSTKIREALLNGHIREATNGLSHPYTLRGTVIHGEKIGSTLGYPTANIELPPPTKLLPPPGVYATYAEVDEQRYQSMLYIGTRPTVTPSSREISIEVHLFEFQGDLYGQDIIVEFIEYIRPDETMADLQQLRSQLSRDKEAVLRAFSGHDTNVPSVAVVVLNYNGRDILEQYLPSFSQHGVDGAETYLADNASTDDSLDFVSASFPSIKIIALPRNFGFADGYNQALDGLSHKYFALVNSDVELTPGWLEPIVRRMEEDEDIAICQPKILDAKDRKKFEYAGACGGFIDFVGYPFCAGRVLNDIEKDEGQYDSVDEIFWSSGAAFVIRSDLFFRTGGFDKDYFAHQEEIDLCWTIKRAGYKVNVVPDSIVYHEGGATLPYHNPGKVYLNFRNNLATLFKQLRRGRFFIVLPVRALLDLLACANFLTSGQLANALAVIKAYISFFLWIPKLIGKRRLLKRTVATLRIRTPNRKGMYNGSMLIQYYLFGKHTYTALMKKTFAKKNDVQETS